MWGAGGQTAVTFKRAIPSRKYFFLFSFFLTLHKLLEVYNLDKTASCNIPRISRVKAHTVKVNGISDGNPPGPP